MGASPTLPPVEPDSDVRRDDSHAAQLQHEWRRFDCVYKRRRAFFARDEGPKSKSTQRLVLISRNEDPWEIFGLTMRLEYCRRVYEWSGLQFSALHEACASGDKQSVRRLLASIEAGHGSSLARDSSGRIPLHQAVICEHHGVVRLLLAQRDARLQLHVKDNRGAPPVQYVLEKLRRLAQQEPAGSSIAARATSTRFQKLWRLADRMLGSMDPGLVQEMRWLDFRTRGDAWDAVRAGDVDRLKTIHELYGQEPSDDLRELHYTLLHEACSATQTDLSVVLYLISKQRLDRAKRSQCGSTPLHCAASRGGLEACVLLLDEDVPDAAIDPDELLMATDGRGRTPLHASLYFIGRGCRNGIDARSDALMTARYLVQRCPQALHVVDLDGFTPLHYAIYCGDLALVELMVALGVNLYHDLQSVLLKGDYGVRAPWAPCRTRLQRKRIRLLPGPGGNEQQNSVSELVTRVEPSMACARMHQVRAGHVEHPGEVVPMETLWFLVQRRPAKSDQPRPAIPSASDEPTGAVTEETTGSPGVADPGQYGCRRFGAICNDCRSKPADDNESDTNPSIHGYKEDAVAMSPLVLAIRCCRLCVKTNQPVDERMKIVETLLLAGSLLDDSAINEAIQSFPFPQLLQLVVLHSGRQLTRDHIVDHFFCFTLSPISSTDPRQAMLTTLLATFPELFDSSLVPGLFRWGYFRAVERIFEIERSQNELLEILVRNMHETPQLPTGSRKSCRQPAFTTLHLDRIMRWRSVWPELSNEFAALGTKCVHGLLQRPIIRTACTRQQMDLSIATAIQQLAGDGKTFMANTGAAIVDWMVKVFEIGLMATARVLWLTISSLPDMTLTLLRSLSWPVRVPNLELDFTKGFAQELVQRTLEIVERENVKDEAVSACFAVASMYITPLETTRRILTRVKAASQGPFVVELLSSRRFGGLTLLQWIIRENRVDMAELLLTEGTSDPDSSEHLWCEFARAAVFTSPANERWQMLLFSAPATPRRRSWLASRLVRVRRSSPLLSAAVSWLTAPANPNDPCYFEWLEGTALVHEMARWNALALMQQLSSAQPDAAANVLSRLVMKRDEADCCTPLELCKLLGHQELACLMRRVASTSTSFQTAQDDDGAWLAARRTHFGLLRSVLSSPTLDTRTYLRSGRAFRIDPCVALSGDWTTAVALNNIRLLETFSLHAIPLASDKSDTNTIDALAGLLETAISHGSLQALEWLLSEKLIDIDIPTSRTTAVLFTAARHTSLVHATMTLVLLQQPGFHPGRLAGDGTDVTLFHRAACFADAKLASSILQLLLAMDGSDVNVRDGFGCTPIAYALASGNLATACFLLDHCAHVRLEAEFEGQNAFYYTLQLLPSFAWRWILQTLLTIKRHAAFLHCTSDDCACKGFERVRSDGGSLDESSVNEDCSFCGHSVESHTRVPFPPWFRDQYETYLNPQQSGDNTANEARDHDDADADADADDEDAASRCRLRALLAKPLENEATLERDRGRLSTRDLERITRFRFRALLSTLALTLPPAHKDPEEEKEEAEAQDARRDKPAAADLRKLPAVNTEPPTISGDSHANLDATSAAKSSIESTSDGASSQAHRAPRRSRAWSLLITPQEASVPPISLSLLPWFVRADVAMVPVPVLHGSLPGTMGFPTTHEEQIHTVLKTWLRVTATRCGRGPHSDRSPTTPTPANVFARWRDVTIAATSTWVSFHARTNAERAVLPLGDGGVHPVALDVSESVPRQPLPEAERKEEPHEVGSSSSLCSSSSSSETASSASTPAALTIGSANANKSLSILLLFLYHWRYARVYQCFRLWKRRCVNVNAQVALHELETLGDSWAADARRVRFQKLLARQRALERSIHDAVG